MNKLYLVFFLVSFALGIGIGFLVNLDGNEVDFNFAEIEKSIENLNIKEDKNFTTTLLFVGDIMLSRSIGNIMEKNKNYLFPFEFSIDFLKKADLTFGNLEGPISDKGKNQGSIYSFRADPKVVEGLIESGFDILSIANNHIFDWGEPALLDTIDRLEKNNISYIGVGKNYQEANEIKIKEINGTKFGFLGLTSLYPKSFWAKDNRVGLTEFDEDKILEKIKKAKENKIADVIIISLHWGEEYQTVSNQFQKNLAHKLVDVGADVVVGHHPHVAQDIERYKDGIIFYSLGNFVFDQNFSKETMEGLVTEIKIKDSKIDKVNIYKAQMNKYYQPSIDFSYSF